VLQKVYSGGSDKVGVGGIDFFSTNYDSTNTTWTNASFDASASNDGGVYNAIIEKKVSVSAIGNKYRVAISWLNHGDYTYIHRNDFYPLGKDFDLSVYNQNGEYTCGNLSRYNPYEYCDFTSNITGEYTVRISRFANRDTANNMSLSMSFNRY